MKNSSSLMIAIVVAMTTACSTMPSAPPPQYVSTAPAAWERVEDIGEVDQRWVAAFESKDLEALIARALSNNHALAGQAAQVEDARQAVIVSRATRLPSLSAGLSGSRRRSGNANTGFDTGSHFTLGVDGQYEVDVWGQLSDGQRRAQHLFRAAQYDYEDRRLQLVADVSIAWYNVIFARQLEELFEQRVENIEKNLDIIEHGYQRGLNSALDVYLSRSSVEQERARWAQQQQTVLEATSNLQLLLADYPGGQWAETGNLPSIDSAVLPGVPASMVARRPDLQSAWFQMLAQDAAVAVAHKNRFPQVIISASLDDAAGNIGDVVDGSGLLWSLVSNVSQPVFNSGRLRAQEEQARQRLVQAEQNYLGSVNQAFAEVENALSERRSLVTRVTAVEQSGENASAAYDLSFQQYQRGLVSYATVLEAEQRSFEAKSNLLELRYRLLVNRVNLNVALGGAGKTL